MLSEVSKIVATGGIGKPINLSEILLFEHAPNRDTRGEFTRIFDTFMLEKLCKRKVEFQQISFSHNLKKHTRRGLHVRKWPEVEPKFVRVLQGAVVDLVLDCRPDSSSFGSWAMYLLESIDGSGICIPGGFAHGIQTTEDNTILAYGMDLPFNPSLDVAINSADKDLSISWGHTFSSMSEKDRFAQTWSEFKDSIWIA
jgi:dTDP-4-dehydrorhamnose 3,5-epimerase